MVLSITKFPSPDQILSCWSSVVIRQKTTTDPSVDGIPSVEWQWSFLRRDKCIKLLFSTFYGFDGLNSLLTAFTAAGVDVL